MAFLQHDGVCWTLCSHVSWMSLLFRGSSSFPTSEFLSKSALVLFSSLASKVYVYTHIHRHVHVFWYAYNSPISLTSFHFNSGHIWGKDAIQENEVMTKSWKAFLPRWTLVFSPRNIGYQKVMSRHNLSLSLKYVTFLCLLPSFLCVCFKIFWVGCQHLKGRMFHIKTQVLAYLWKKNRSGSRNLCLVRHLSPNLLLVAT